MRESDTYQAILEEGEAVGRLGEARELLIGLGTKRLGPFTPAGKQSIESIASAEALEAPAERLFEVETGAELLQ